MSTDSPSRFKSRFSLLSLLPSRHPPLSPSQPVPTVPSLPYRLSQLPPRPLDAIQPLPSLNQASSSSSSSSHLLPANGHVHAPKLPTLVSRSSALSTAHSEYPDTAASQKDSPPLLPPVSTYPVPPRRPRRPDDGGRRTPVDLVVRDVDEKPRTIEKSTGKSPSSRRRPPPLDLSKTRKAYPGVAGVIACVPTPEPVAPPRRKELPRGGGWFGFASPQKAEVVSDPLGSSDKPKKAEKVRLKAPNDPFEVCEIEPGHKYASWKQGRVSIRPGQITPQGTLANLTPTIRGRVDVDGRDKVGGPSAFQLQPPSRGPSQHKSYDNNYDSVLHNVLLTPTYLGASPTTEHAHPSTREERRKSLLNRVGDAVTDTGKWAGKSILNNRNEQTADRVVLDMRERETRELARFRQATRPYPLQSTDELVVVPPVRQVIYISGSSDRDYEYGRRSPGYSERYVGVRHERKYRKQEPDNRLSKGGMWCCFRRKKEESKKKKKKMYKVSDNSSGLSADGTTDS